MDEIFRVGFWLTRYGGARHSQTLIEVGQYSEITEINLSAFVYRLFHEDFSSLARI